MDKKKILLFARRVLFLVLLASILMYTSAVLERKTVTGAWNYSLKVGGYQNEPENTFDVVGIGSSHMYCTLNPLHLYEQTGLRSYVLATQQQPPMASLYYAKEALKTQKPDVLVIEALMFSLHTEKASESVAHDAIDPFPNTLNKLLMIHRMNQVDGKENYYFNIMKYHNRWKELSAGDFDFSYREKTDPYRGLVFLTKAGESTFTTVSYDDTEPAVLRAENRNILLELKALAEENNTKLLLFFAPFTQSDTQKGLFKALHVFAEENGIETLDLNLPQEGVAFDPATDFFDEGHLNVFGSEKATEYLGRYLLEGGMATVKTQADEELWLEDLEIYHQAKANAQQP